MRRPVGEGRSWPTTARERQVWHGSESAGECKLSLRSLPVIDRARPCPPVGRYAVSTVVTHTFCPEGRVPDSVSRRDFVEQLGVIGATWMLAMSPGTMSGIEPHPHGSVPAPTLRFFGAVDAKEIAAIAERIIPSDDGPGAKEAGALYFIDGGLVTFAKDQQRFFRDGLADLTKRVSATFPPATLFSSLTTSQQDQLLKSMEQTPFFQAMRLATIAGMFCLPQYGGNRSFVGWKAIGLQEAPTYAPPFGYYDRPEMQRKLTGGDA